MMNEENVEGGKWLNEAVHSIWNFQQQQQEQQEQQQEQQQEHSLLKVYNNDLFLMFQHATILHELAEYLIKETKNLNSDLSQFPSVSKLYQQTVTMCELILSQSIPSETQTHSDSDFHLQEAVRKLVVKCSNRFEKQ
jgi:hypothetical protein